MATFSFDIISDYNKAEMNNVFMQSEKAIGGRYDFKGTPAAIEWLKDKSGFKLIGSITWQVEAILELVRGQLTKRGQSIKTLDLSSEIIEQNLKATWDIPFVSGLSQDKAKQITKILREETPKVKAQIQGEMVRVTSGSKDELQGVMRILDAADLDFPLEYTNYR